MSPRPQGSGTARAGSKKTGAGRRRRPSGAPILEEELRTIVARLARGGNMPACRFYYERWIAVREEARPNVVDDPLAEADELARRRSAR